MIVFEPEERVGNEKIPDLVASVIEYQRAPLLMHPSPWVFMLIKGGAVKSGESMGVGGEMTRHPVHDHPQTMLMTLIDKIHEIRRTAVSRRRREIAGHLITP